jgi:hypothetical protein
VKTLNLVGKQLAVNGKTFYQNNHGDKCLLCAWVLARFDTLCFSKGEFFTVSWPDDEQAMTVVERR